MFCINKETSGVVKPFADLSLVIYAGNFHGSSGEVVKIHERGLGRREAGAKEILEMLEGTEGRIKEVYSQKMREELSYVANFKKLLEKSIGEVKPKRTP